MSDDLQARIARWRKTADLDARAGAPVGSALREACDELDRLEDHNADLLDKLDGETSCACSWDDPGDVCVAHSPPLKRALKRAEQAERERDEARAAATTCGASMVVGGIVGTVGPCLLRHGHDGPVHQGAGSVQWSEAVLGDAEDFSQQVEDGDHDKPLADWEREVMEKQYLRGRVDQAEAALQRVQEEHQPVTGRMNRCRVCRTAWPCRTYRSTEPLAEDDLQQLRARAALDQPKETL